MPTLGVLPVTLIIPCGGAKASEPKPARDLYTGSMFRHTLAAVLAVAGWCQARGIPSRILILSAKHGLIGLDEVLAPYDLKMGDPGSVAAAALARQARQLGMIPGEPVCAFLPRPYLARLREALRDLGMTVQDKYAGARGIGEQRRVNAAVTRAPGTCLPDGLLAGLTSPGPAAPERAGEPVAQYQLW